VSPTHLTSQQACVFYSLSPADALPLLTATHTAASPCLAGERGAQAHGADALRNRDDVSSSRAAKESTESREEIKVRCHVPLSLPLGNTRSCSSDLLSRASTPIDHFPIGKRSCTSRERSVASYMNRLQMILLPTLDYVASMCLSRIS
jgi:hypothetical protein